MVAKSGKRWLLLSVVALTTLAVAAGWAFRDHWTLWSRDPITTIAPDARDDHVDGSASWEDHEHAGHGQATCLTLSEHGRRNIGLQTCRIEPQMFERTITVPAMIVERPGRSQVDITAPLTGIVTRIYPIEGEAATPGQMLFELRLTHEDLVTAQRDFLRYAEELDVINRDIARLEGVSDGVIAGKRILEKKYEQQKTEAALHAQRQGLLLHGLSQQQIDDIIATRKLLQRLTVVAPPYVIDEHDHDLDHLYHVQKVLVKRGEQVSAGDTLGVLADHCELYVEGQAFEDDAERLTRASNQQWQVTAVPVSDGSGPPKRLDILYLSDQVDSESRALRFYMRIGNEIARDVQMDGHRFIGWKYRPGQRLQVRVPVQHWEQRIVLPADAVVEEGVEAFIFLQRGDHFDRVPVHVEYRNGDRVVIANDGSLVGRTVAMSGAYQMQLALKNKASGGIDPHAGHNH